jgi:DNA repair exonuclease SbcCD ATPase subunit
MEAEPKQITTAQEIREAIGAAKSKLASIDYAHGDINEIADSQARLESRIRALEARLPAATIAEQMEEAEKIAGQIAGVRKELKEHRESVKRLRQSIRPKIAELFGERQEYDQGPALYRATLVPSDAIINRFLDQTHAMQKAHREQERLQSRIDRLAERLRVVQIGLPDDDRIEVY